MYRALCVLQTYFRIRLAYKKRLKNKNKIFPKKFFFFFTFFLCNFSVRTLQCFQIFFFFFDHKKLKKTPQKVAHNWPKGVFFFSAAPTAQTSPELHFRFMNSFIQSSLVRSLLPHHSSTCFQYYVKLDNSWTINSV